MSGPDFQEDLSYLEQWLHAYTQSNWILNPNSSHTPCIQYTQQRILASFVNHTVGMRTTPDEVVIIYVSPPSEVCLECSCMLSQKLKDYDGDWNTKKRVV